MDVTSDVSFEPFAKTTMHRVLVQVRRRKTLGGGDAVRNMAQRFETIGDEVNAGL